MNSKKLLVALSLFVGTVFSQASFAQGLNWEGQTGALLTPFAYTAASPAKSFGKPEVAFHYLNTGSNIGNDFQISVEEGVAKRIEFGVTAALVKEGSVVEPVPAHDFAGNFVEVNGKVTIVDENAGKNNWVPAIAVGGVGRFDTKRLSYYFGNKNEAENNGDFYIVATKTVTQVKGFPFVLSIGEKVSNAVLFGVAGSSAKWEANLFGAAAFVVKGPAKSTLIFGSEAVAQPHHIDSVPTAVTIPTSLSYFVRVVPHIEHTPLQVDLGVAQLAGKVLPGVIDLHARARVGMGVSYHF